MFQFLSADANAAQGAGNFGTVYSIVMIVIFFAFFYFAIIRPQKKERRKQEALMNSLEIGDSVCTTAGFYGVIIDIMEDVVVVEFGSNKNCRIPMKKGAIVDVEKPSTEEAK